jgi:hypothetical protein
MNCCIGRFKMKSVRNKKGRFDGGMYAILFVLTLLTATIAAYAYNRDTVLIPRPDAFTRKIVDNEIREAVEAAYAQGLMEAACFEWRNRPLNRRSQVNRVRVCDGYDYTHSPSGYWDQVSGSAGVLMLEKLASN